MPSEPTPALSPEAASVFQRLAGFMIPPAPERQLPGADDAEIFADILRSLDRDAAAIQRALAQLSETADGAFTTLSRSDAQALAMTFLEQRSADIIALGRAVLQCYYRDDRVLRANGIEPRAPFPKGNTLPSGDWSLLDAVKQRPAMWRDVPGKRS